ncbi:MAG TPA: bifunctional serine/threonine-protein kinase/formylglycine-generating enzyme family protein [Pyrinomonadaceae bacterium]|nr:bifunctional serine/threonine-protein kinase/formylglycine-generating enzyme family protein [Pyrinomonadaceae bacterium]
MEDKILKGRYRILNKIKKGGFGETFLAEDLDKFKGTCVVKQLSFYSSDPGLYQSFQERFELEGRVLTELGKHPQIPELYAYFEEDGELYLVQEFIVGKTLEDILQSDGRFSEKAVKKVLIDLLPVLDHVHAKRKVHRDITPKNIILRESDGLPVLIDFGAVKELQSLSANPQASPVSSTINIGTPGYIAPEQINGFPGCYSDLYSLGATALRLLTGKEPQLLTASRKKDEGWRRYAPEVTESFASIVNKAIQLEAYNRYATALEIMDDLLNSRVVHPEDDEEPTAPFDRGLPLVDMATGQQLIAVKSPAGFRLPSEHLYLGEGKQTGERLLYRSRDGQVVLYIPKDVRTGSPFLIDRHLVTNAQFAAFLNDPEVKHKIQQTRSNDVTVAVTFGGDLLLADAYDYFERNAGRTPGKVAGLTYSSQRWVSLDGSGHLPAALVSVMGATWYAAWLRKVPLEDAQLGNGLPCESQWTTGALFDESIDSLRRFPWGGDWERQKLNSLSYWAGRDISEWESGHAAKAGLTPVGAFTEGASPCGMMDAFGNVWEWLNNSDQSGKYVIKGGAYSSPKSVFESPTMLRQPEFLSPAIGFRCGWYL